MGNVRPQIMQTGKILLVFFGALFGSVVGLFVWFLLGLILIFVFSPDLPILESPIMIRATVAIFSVLGIYVGLSFWHDITDRR